MLRGKHFVLEIIFYLEHRRMTYLEIFSLNAAAIDH